MTNNSKFGFTIQKTICDIFGINVENERLCNLFKTNCDSYIIKNLMTKRIIYDIFKSIGKKPIKCTTLIEDDNNNICPYNFILDNGETLSIRTYKHLSKLLIAPRIIGQAGYKKLNEFFSEIYGDEIKTQSDIKRLICNHIDEVLPIFVDQFLDADYIVFICEERMEEYKILRGNSSVDIDYRKDYFSFTSPLKTWNECTSLKYKNITIASIQTHKNRTFKFRFVVKNFLLFVEENKKNNETFGITAEKAICEYFGIAYPDNFKNRIDSNLEKNLKPLVEKAFKHLPNVIKHCGSEPGERGGNSKCSFDFLLEGNKTLSLKTNYGRMVCPPEVGQPNDKTCYLYFNKFVDGDHIDRDNFKCMAYNHIKELIEIYEKFLFDSDYLLRFYIKKGKYHYDISNRISDNKDKWEKEHFSFSKKTINEWNVSNTVYYNGIRLGEFEVHNSRNCYKFRFDYENLLKINDNINK